MTDRQTSRDAHSPVPASPERTAKLRCFVAVAAGPAITERMAAELPALRDEAARCGVKVTWSLPDGWHVTLKFLGDIDESDAPRIARRLAELAPGHEPFTITAHGMTVLPPGSRKPNVLAVEIEADDRLARLAAAVDHALAQLGFERERRAFRPHVTAGRVRNPRGWLEFAPAIGRLRDRSFGSAEVRELSLYRSRLGDGPARYEALASFALGTSEMDVQAEDPSRRKGERPSS